MTGPHGLDPDWLLSGDRRTLSRALTLAESARHGAAAQQLTDLLAAVAGRRSSLRVCLAGPPGAGKSSLIDALGLALCEAGRSVAVLPVDPRSPRSGGALLGDKLRMARLAERDDAYVRPVVCRTAFGGVFAGWHESILLCEAAGFDVVLTETIGVGQGEVASSLLADVYAVALAPGLGDEIQGLKRGALELADVIVVTKADGSTAELAKSTARAYRQAMTLYGGRVARRRAEVLAVSAHLGEGIEALVEAIDRVAADPDGEERSTRRRRGLHDWLRHQLVEQFAERLAADGDADRLIEKTLDGLENGRALVPSTASDILDGLMAAGSSPRTAPGGEEGRDA